MSVKEFLKDWLPPAVVRLGRALRPRGPGHAAGMAGAVRYPVGSCTLLLPRDHALPELRRHWPLYDEPLRHVADALRQVHGPFRAIDIGANVGDSAAILNAGGPTPVLCIEGDPAYHPFLDANANALGKHVVLEKCFVGLSDEDRVASDDIVRRSGTTAVRRATTATEGAGLGVARLESILSRHPDFHEAKLVKIDTDGWDFDILLAHRDVLAGRKPVLFFEYLLGQDKRSSHEQSLRCIDTLLELGYERFLIFDHYGHYLLSTSERSTFEELNLYLLSNAAYGTAVHYLDVCALAEADLEVGRLVRWKTEQLVLGSRGSSRVMPDRAIVGE